MKVRNSFSILLLFSFLLGCGVTQLIDIQKSSSALDLSVEQQEKIHPKLKLIRDIVEDYEFEKREFDAEMREYRILREDRSLYRNDWGIKYSTETT